MHQYIVVQQNMFPGQIVNIYLSACDELFRIVQNYKGLTRTIQGYTVIYTHENPMIHSFELQEDSLNCKHSKQYFFYLQRNATGFIF